jgi:hypothetical protein
MTFTFRGINGDVVSVEAPNEEEARHRAMTKRWGPAGRDTIVPDNRYEGFGLTLIREGEHEQAARAPQHASDSQLDQDCDD